MSSKAVQYQASWGISLAFAMICFLLIWYMGHDFPGVRGIDIGLTKDKILLNIIVLLVFSLIYSASMLNCPEWWAWADDSEQQRAIDGEMSWIDACSRGFYFGFITHSTIGYGDFYPSHHVTRAIVMIHAALIILINFAGSTPDFPFVGEISENLITFSKSSSSGAT